MSSGWKERFSRQNQRHAGAFFVGRVDLQRQLHAGRQVIDVEARRLVRHVGEERQRRVLLVDLQDEPLLMAVVGARRALDVDGVQRVVRHLTALQLTGSVRKDAEDTRK